MVLWNPATTTVEVKETVAWSSRGSGMEACVEPRGDRSGEVIHITSELLLGVLGVLGALASIASFVLYLYDRKKR